MRWLRISTSRQCLHREPHRLKKKILLNYHSDVPTAVNQQISKEYMKNSTVELYQKQIVDINFERAGLFKALKERYDCNEALYPGSSVHITPSLYYPHVVYVDQSTTAAEFFSDMDGIQAYVRRNKHYKQRAYISFIAQDYTVPLPLPKGGFDLLISLYAGGVSQACKEYLKIGGILVTNDHQNDVDGVMNYTGFKLIAMVKYSGGKYRFLDEDGDIHLAAVRKRKKRKDFLQTTSQGFAYREDIDVYFIFERCAGSPSR